MYKIETELEADGRWIAEVPELAGVLVYGATRDEAVRKAHALSVHVLAERLEHGESLPQPKLTSGIKVLRGPMAAAARKRLSGPDITTSCGTHIVQRKS